MINALTMNDGHSNKGYDVLTGTSAIAKACQGFTPLSDDFTIAAIIHPSSRGARAYQSDTTGLVAIASGGFVKGCYYPIPFTSITPGSGSAIGWLD